jgi:hypothetical protein
MTLFEIRSRHVNSGILLSCILFIFSNCTFRNEEELFGEEICIIEEVAYFTDIRPLIETRCVSCHSSVLSSGNINLESYDKLVPVVESGRFLGSISHSPGFTPMPQGEAKLSNCDIQKIEKWIEEGFPNN